jgi:DNA-binding MarR family transcriptional regulator
MKGEAVPREAPRETGRVSANAAWESLLAAHAALMREFAADDVWEDLSMKEYDVLYTLSKYPEPTRVGELNRHVLISQPALSRLVDRLVDRGLVYRVADPSDGRGVRVGITEAGQQQQHRVGDRHGREVSRALRSRLTSDELARLQEICTKLADQRPLF